MLLVADMLFWRHGQNSASGGARTAPHPRMLASGGGRVRSKTLLSLRGASLQNNRAHLTLEQSNVKHGERTRSFSAGVADSGAGDGAFCDGAARGSDLRVASSLRLEQVLERATRGLY